ncbi:unnamed protein product [Colias eurytheme]|nr:unnamed protein product [Colias eurytheme]
MNTYILYFSLITLIWSSAARREHILREEEDDDSNIQVRSKYNLTHAPTTTGRSLKGEMVVEKFVDTLMASERYLKMVESVEKKINHLDANFHDRTNTILKYLAEVLRIAKTAAAPQDVMEKTLRSLKHDLDKLQQAVSEKVKALPKMRVKAAYANYVTFLVDFLHLVSEKPKYLT